jgi:hypothetical protein
MPVFARASRATTTSPEPLYSGFRDTAGADRDRVPQKVRKAIGSEEWD